jgi:uncharacterized protein YbaR (Trm112 family)
MGFKTECTVYFYKALKKIKGNIQEWFEDRGEEIELVYDEKRKLYKITDSNLYFMDYEELQELSLVLKNVIVRYHYRDDDGFNSIGIYKNGKELTLDEQGLLLCTNCGKVVSIDKAEAGTEEDFTNFLINKGYEEEDALERLKDEIGDEKLLRTFVCPHCENRNLVKEELIYYI